MLNHLSLVLIELFIYMMYLFARISIELRKSNVLVIVTKRYAYDSEKSF